MNKFWIYNPSIILDKNKYWQIIPTSEMTLTEQLNTISRFLIYLIVLLILFKRDSVLLLLAIVAIIIIIIYHSLYVSDVNSVKLDINENFIDEFNEYNSPKNIITSPINTIDMVSKNNKGNMVTKINKGDMVTKINKGNMVDIGNKDYTYYSSIVDGPDINSISSPLPNNVSGGLASGTMVNRSGGGGGGDSKAVDIQTAYIDSNGDYVFGDLKKDSNVHGDDDSKGGGGGGGGITYKMNDDYVNSTCRKPTVDNPYANIVFSDYLDAGNVASPCNVDDDELPKKSLALYNSSIFRNVDDVFERENSQRLFYTLPINTIPNKQTEFARWLYDTGPRCKEDTSKCTYYEDPSMTSPRY